jgi:hypothetical protein
MDNTTDFNATVCNQLRRLRAMSEDAHGTAEHLRRQAQELLERAAAADKAAAALRAAAEALDSESNYAAWD